MVRYCSANNTAVADETGFFNPDFTVNWDAHRIGWAVAGGCAALATLISGFTIFMHCRNFYIPSEQRQIVRILLMPVVYAIISFFSYRYYREYTYYEVAETIWEAFTLAAFLVLLIQYVAKSPEEQREILAEKDKRKLPFPFNCWRFRASKPYFMYTIKWSVLQYAILRPLLSIISIICEARGLLCTEEYSVHYAEVYIVAIDFVSISIALYGLIVFYSLTKQELQGRRPLAKFLSIKLIVMFTFYQSFLFGILADHGVLKASKYWTTTNVSDGLNALCICIEMVIFSIFMGWAFQWRDYTSIRKSKGVPPPMGAFRAFLHALNMWDFVLDSWYSLVFFYDYMTGKPHARGHKNFHTDFDAVFLPSPAGAKKAPSRTGSHSLSSYHTPTDVERGAVRTPLFGGEKPDAYGRLPSPTESVMEGRGGEGRDSREEGSDAYAMRSLGSEAGRVH